MKLGLGGVKPKLLGVLLFLLGCSDKGGGTQGTVAGGPASSGSPTAKLSGVRVGPSSSSQAPPACTLDQALAKFLPTNNPDMIGEVKDAFAGNWQVGTPTSGITVFLVEGADANQIAKELGATRVSAKELTAQMEFASTVDAIEALRAAFCLAGVEHAAMRRTLPPG